MIPHTAYDGLVKPFARDLAGATTPDIIYAPTALPTHFRVAEASAAAIAACGTAAAELWRLKTATRQTVSVDMRGAEASLTSFFHLRLNGKNIPVRAIEVPSTGLFETRGGQWIHLHGGFPHFHDGTLKLLGCNEERAAIADAVRRWDADALEDALAEAGQCGAVARSAEAWAAHPQGQATAGRPLVEVTKIADSPPEPVGGGDRPLSGLRVLDLTRVLAGPTCARTLAEHGAEVLRIGASSLPSIEPFVMDTGHGKRAAYLDLERPTDLAQLHALVQGADILSQGYRTDALDRFGLSPEACAVARPGLVFVSVNCYGHEGPWRDRRGWEQLAQATTGIAVQQGAPNGPTLIPAAVCDYTTGYLAAFGALIALIRRVHDGGSYSVRVSLCGTASWIHALGLTDQPMPQTDHRPPGTIQRGSYFSEADIEALSVETDTHWGRMRHLAPIVQLSQTPARWEQPCVPLGTDPPRWRD